MSSETTPINPTAIYTALQQTMGFRSILTTLAVLSSAIWIAWSLAHAHLGVAPVPVGVARLQIFLAGLWFVHGAAMALINHTIVTFFRVGVETVALTAAGVAEAMHKTQAVDAGTPAPSAVPSTITYLQEALLRRAEDAAKKDQ